MLEDLVKSGPIGEQIETELEPGDLLNLLSANRATRTSGRPLLIRMARQNLRSRAFPLNRRQKRFLMSKIGSMRPNTAFENFTGKREEMTYSTRDLDRLRNSFPDDIYQDAIAGLSDEDILAIVALA